MRFSNKFTTRFFVAFTAFSIGIAVTVFWIFSQEVYQLPPLNREKLEISDSENLPEIKRQREFMKQRIDEFPQFKRDLNRNVLKPLQEKPLAAFSDSVNENYRFLWIPSFDPAVAIRVWREGDKKFLSGKIAAGEGFTVKKSASNIRKNLTENEWEEFLKVLERSGFWSKPLFEIDDEPIYDGAFYIYEGKKDRRFHEIHRFTADEQFRELGRFLINLAEFKTE